MDAWEVMQGLPGRGAEGRVGPGATWPGEDGVQGQWCQRLGDLGPEEVEEEVGGWDLKQQGC